MEGENRAMNMTGKQFAEGLITEIEKRERRHIKTLPSWDTLKELVGDVLDPKPEQKNVTPFYAPPVIPPEWPKLKVLYDAAGNRKEWLIVQNFTQEQLYHAGGWFTRPMTEVESLKADGIQERPLSDHDRRADKFRYANP
jgi:hypothetical protein